MRRSLPVYGWALLPLLHVSRGMPRPMVAFDVAVRVLASHDEPDGHGGAVRVLDRVAVQSVSLLPAGGAA
jgi:hypothetical protein